MYDIVVTHREILLRFVVWFYIRLAQTTDLVSGPIALVPYLVRYNTSANE